MTTKVEYRVRPITRYVVTRHFSQDDGPNQAGGSETRGIFDNDITAYEVAYALCKAEHDMSGLPAGDEGFIYPETPAQLGRASRLSVVDAQQALAE